MARITARLTTGMVVQLSNGRHEWSADEPLGAGGTDDPEEFRHRAAQDTERRDLERRRGELLIQLQRLSGPGEQFDRFKEALAQASPPMPGSDPAIARRYPARPDLSWWR